MAFQTRSRVDTKEFELPDTLLVSDIENQVFQSIVVQVLSTIQDIALLEKNLIEDLLGREENLRLKGIVIEQDNPSRCVNIRVEINVAYGVALPAKAEEIQNKIIEDITKLTGLHVGIVHVVFKNIISSAACVLIPPLREKANYLEEDDYQEEF
jgi:uncharacterized alkaline shock family protein YloU